MDAPETIVLTLPEPPSSNRYWRMGRSGLHGAPRHMFRSETANAYGAAVGMLTAQYRTRGQCAFPSGDLSVTVLWHRSARRGDLDNRIKVFL